MWAVFPLTSLWTWLPCKTSRLDSPLIFPQNQWCPESGPPANEGGGWKLMSTVGIQPTLVVVGMLLQACPACTVTRSLSVGTKDVVWGGKQLRKVYTSDQNGPTFNRFNLHY